MSLSRLLADAIDIVLVLLLIAAFTWLGLALLFRGPGPHSRLERLLDEHEADEAGRRGLEDRSDEEGPW